MSNEQAMKHLVCGICGLSLAAGGLWAAQPLGLGCGTATGTWSYWQRDGKGAETALTACTLNGGAVKGFAHAGRNYPFVVAAESPVHDLEKFSIPLKPGTLAVHPAPSGETVLRFTVGADGNWTIKLRLADAKVGGNANDVGVNAALSVAGKPQGEKMYVSAERGKGPVSRTLRKVALRAGDVVELVIDANGGYACDGTEVLFDVSPYAPPADLVQVPGDWAMLPPADVDPALAATADPRTRRWSGQKAALRFANVHQTANRIRVEWEEAPTDAKTLPGDPKSLWQGRHPAKPAVSTPRFHWVGTDLRLFAGEAPDAAVLLPFCVIEDGSDEDGYGGYVIGMDGPAFAVAREEKGIALVGDGKPFVFRFDGNWIAALQTVARRRPEWFKAPAGLSAPARAAFEAMTPDLRISVLAEWAQDEGRVNGPAYGWLKLLEARIACRQKLLADPRLAATLKNGLTFITRRQPTWNHEVAQYFGWRQDPGGTVLVLEKPGQSLATRDLIAGRMPHGSYLQPRLSYDAKKLLFAFVETEGAQDPYTVIKVNEEDTEHHYYHLWEINVDGTGLKQLTKGVYEDFMPEFLPDGDIVFMSSRRKSQSRCFWYGYSNRWQAYIMYRMKPDGSDLQQLSWNDVAEWFPTMSNEGEVLFALWDYIDRDAVRHQNLWSMRPDGTNPKALWGNETPDPHCTFQLRAIPGSRRIVAIASAHHACTGGPVVLIDPSVDENSEAAITHVTPGHYPEIDIAGRRAAFPMPNAEDPRYGDNDWYNSPHPYGEDLFLVAWSRDALHYEPSRRNPDAALGLYVLSSVADPSAPNPNVNRRIVRELLYRDGRLSAQCPEPLVARPVPPRWISQFEPSLRAANKGEVFISDVHRGLKKVAPGSLKQVRVVQLYPRTAPDQYLPNAGCGGHENARAVIGTAKVESDGSARFLVPAKTPLLFQVLDADGCAWRTMRSATSLMPGERVSCVGCHESKREAGAAAATVSEAMKKPAQELAVPPEGGRPWGFVENVQPIFDRKCVSCHAGDKPPRGVNLTREPDPRFSHGTTVKTVGPRQFSAPFTKSYATLVWTDEPTGRKPTNKQFQHYKYRMRTGKDGTAVRMVPNWPEYNLVQTTPEGPGNNALGSGLMSKLSKGKHGALLTPEEKRMIATWIDLNAMFYGCYEEPNLSKQLKGEPIPPPDNF